MHLVRDEEPLYIIGYGVANLYRTLKSTRFSIYMPYLSILVNPIILDATIAYLRNGGYAGLTLEEYLSRIDLL